MKKSLMIFCLVMLIFIVGSVSALSCMQISVEEEFGNSSAVFSGNVTKIETIVTGFGEMNKITFNGIYLWKGIYWNDSNGSIVVFTSKQSEIGYNFSEGMKYLVYARDFGDAGPSLNTNACSLTKRLENASEDIITLNQLVSNISQIACTQDVLMCSDGSVLQRDPLMNCTFHSCPVSTCKNQGEMCGGIAGFQCCNGLGCELEGNYPDAAGICVVLDEDICLDQCGDGICQEVVCTGAGCPCAENVSSCLQDCSLAVEESSGEFHYGSLLFVIGAVVFIFIGFKILKWVFWTLAIIAVILAVLFWIF